MKIVVAYSGGLDTSVILNWLKETYSAEVIAFCANIGQEEELEGLEEKALKTGATKCFVEDICEEFARDWSEISQYRGQNSNMHLTEALMAAYEATGDKSYLGKAERTVARKYHLIVKGAHELQNFFL